MSVFAFLFKQPDDPRIKKIESDDLNALLENDDVFLVDVRKSKEHNRSCIKGSVSIPLSLFSPERISSKDNKKVVFYCRKGIKCKKACKKFIQSRAEETCYYLAGGFRAWMKQGFVCDLGQ